MTTYVKHRFHLDPTTKSYLRSLTPQFGYNGLGELIFYRTYSRTKPDGSQENWADTVIRVTEGTFSIRKDWYLKNDLEWDEEHYQYYARSFATSMFRMEWLPPGRGLWAMGTDFIYERGSMPLYSCAFTLLKADTLAEDLAWLMDCLMLGVGVGFVPERDALSIPGPKGKEDVQIQDSREGWVESVQLLVDAYLNAQPLPVFDYSAIRPAGKPIKGFGGVASGPQPLIDLHKAIMKEFENYKDVVYLKTNLANLIGKCVVAGNVRRSAEIALGAIDDPIFKSLKDYERFPEREAFGWLSNNSVILDADSSFDKLGEIAEGILRNGEPGFVNRRNFKFGRVGRPMDGLRIDKAVGVNPCVTAETKICVADGRGFVPIGELVGTDPLVYCIDDKDEVVVRKMRHVRKTGEKLRIVRVTFDDGNYIRVTENHRIMLRNRSFVQAKDLEKGQQVAIFNRYVPTPLCQDKDSSADQYISIGYGEFSDAEHRILGHFLYPDTDKRYHIHHKDGNKLNNSPANLAIRDPHDHLSEHGRAESNPNWSGYTQEDLLNIGIKLARTLGRRFSSKEWQAHARVHHFSDWRSQEFGSLAKFACLCAEIAGVRNDSVDTRLLRTHQEMVTQGYKAEIVDDEVFVQKTCEGCGSLFWIAHNRREQACCSHSCANTIRDYSKNQEGQRKIYSARRETLREKQLDVYTSLRHKLGREPLRNEWQQACKFQGISFEMYRKGSPFPGWKALKLAAASHNHRVESVVYDGEEDVYNGTVDDYHNFIIGGWEEMTPGGRQVSRGIVNANCGEVVLEDKETCNICETFPTVGDNWYQACGHAAFYCTTVSLLPTHQPRTNAIVARNRRIGIGIVDFTGWKQKEGVHRVIRMLRHGYQLVRETADLLNDEAGIPHPIRYTTVKPGGTTPKLPGRTSGAGHPTFSYTLRRIRIAKNSPIHPLLVEAAIPYEEDAFDPYTDCFEFPILQGPALPADRISLWEQAFNLVTLQREWADNAVSNTLYFKPKLVLKEVIKKGEEAKLKNYRNEGKKYKIVGDEFQYKVYEYDPNHEEHDVEPVLSMLAPVVKSVSMLPHTPKGVYRQMPEEAITKEEYEKRLKAIKPIDWSKLRGSDGMDEKYCQGDRCEIQL